MSLGVGMKHSQVQFVSHKIQILLHPTYIGRVDVGLIKIFDN